jgi:hypothetical protein
MEFGSPIASADESLYWRATGSDYLFEVKLEARTGTLAEMSVVLVPPERVRSVPSLASVGMGTRREDGHPVFDVGPWTRRMEGRALVSPSMRRIDEDAPFTVALGADGVVLMMSGVSPVKHVVDGQVAFAFDAADAFCGVACVLAPEDVLLFRNAYVGERRRESREP